ncbi:MAG TPA: agmatinase [Armatimonadetes bacterium]|nr:agmatinase [Armatimonadota bacterium]
MRSWQPFLESRPDVHGAITIVGIPWDSSASYHRGMRLAPDAIRRASDSIESYSAIFDRDLKAIDVADAGNMVLPNDHTNAMDAIATLSERMGRSGARLVFLGGDHSITIGILRGLQTVYEGIQVIVLDAHSDWRNEYNGTPFSHACTIRRLVEAIGSNSVYVSGVRSFIGGEPKALFYDIEKLPMRINPALPLYLSIDLDVLDVSICPAVGNPEPDGISYRDVLNLLHALRTRHCNVVSIDVVELCPQLDAAETSAIVAAKIVQESIIALWG